MMRSWVTVSFTCKLCGSCCKNLRGRIKRSHEISPNLFMAVPMHLKTIPLFEWEVDNLTGEARRLSINLKVKPDIIILDEKSGMPIVLFWNLEHEDCPFLSLNNRCIIHDKKPLVCQSFPLEIIGDLANHQNPFVIRLGDCPNVNRRHYVDMPILMRRPATSNDLQQAYGETFIGALRFKRGMSLILNLWKNLEKKGMMRSAVISREIMEKILRSKPIGLLKFSQSMGFTAKESFQNEVRQIYSFKPSAREEGEIRIFSN